MVHLVDDHVIELVSGEAIGVRASSELGDRGEDERSVERGLLFEEPAHARVTIAVVDQAAEGVSGLAENLAPMCDEEQSRLASQLIPELAVVEGGEPGLAEAGGQDDNRATPTLEAGCLKGGEGLNLHLMGRVQGGDHIGVELCGGQSGRPQTGAARIVGDPLRGQRTGLIPERVGGLADALPGARLGGAVGAEVPFDAVRERAEGQVAAADIRDSEPVPFELPGLGVKRATTAGQLADLDDAALEGAGGGIVLVGLAPGLLPVEQNFESAGLGDLEVVAGDEPYARSAEECGMHGVLDVSEPGLLDERGDDRDVLRSPQQGQDMARERIELTAGGEGLHCLREVVAPAGQHVSHPATRIVRVPAVARNDMHMQVHDGLSGRCTCVETDVVSVGRELDVELPLDDLDEFEQRMLLLAGRVEPGRYEAPRNDERVSLADRKRVAQRERERIARDVLRRQSVEERAARHQASRLLDGQARRRVGERIPEAERHFFGF